MYAVKALQLLQHCLHDERRILDPLLMQLPRIPHLTQWGESKLEHVSVLVKVWTWITDNLDNLYSCPCGLSCLWTKSYVLVNKPDALLFETTTPPLQAEMEVIRSEMLDRENIQKFWDEKMNAEKTRGLEVEKAYLAALSDLEQEKIIQQQTTTTTKPFPTKWGRLYES
ncbi:hypothetical protein ACFX2A_035435 [Malus domestica]